MATVGMLTGASKPGRWGSGYLTPSNRQALLTVSYADDLERLPERLHAHFTAALTWHLEDAAQRVIDTARTYLVRLEEAPVMHDSQGREIHGYDTGLMYLSMKYELMEALLVQGVFYELRSDEAEYWEYVEFGHWVFSKDGPWFWPGYHFFATAIEQNMSYIRERCREAWQDTALQLAFETRVSATQMGRLGFQSGPGISGITNVADVRPY